MKWAIGIAVVASLAIGGFFGVRSMIAADRYAQALAMCATNPEAASDAIAAIRAVYGDAPRGLGMKVAVCNMQGSVDRLERLNAEVKALGG
jgi:hypothetical protein